MTTQQNQRATLTTAICEAKTCTHIYQINAYSRYKKCIKCKEIKKDI